MKTNIIFLAISIFAAIDPYEAKSQSFSFAFMTDIHLSFEPADNTRGWPLALEHAKENGVDFVITGGDNVDIDGLKDSAKAITRYQNFAEFLNGQSLPIHPTVGNHDRCWAFKKNSSMNNTGLWEKHIGKPYYSFDHKGWHFIVLNTTEIVRNQYAIGEEQKAWLIEDLKKPDPNTPLVVSVHVPFLTVYYPALEGRYTAADTFRDFRDIWDLFNGLNLKLVLQGHQHLYEEIKVLDVQFITGGAVSAAWWGGAFHGTEEGYLLVDVNGHDFSWQYIDYGWEAEKNEP